MRERYRDQWNNPYAQDWDQNQRHSNRSMENLQTNRGYGNASYGQSRGNYGTSEGYSQGSSFGNRNRGGSYREGRFGRGYTGSGQGIGMSNYERRNREQGRGYGYGTAGNYYNTSADLGDRDTDMESRDYMRNRLGRESSWGNMQGTSYGEQEYTGSNLGRQDFDRDRGREDRSWWDKTSDEVSSWFGDEDAERRRDSDRQMTGMHRGKGPKGYHRSDERIMEDVSDRLSDDDYVDASDIDVQVTGSEVILTGTVDSRDAKRRAEDIAEQISGVRNVENRLRVGTERIPMSGSSKNV